MTLDEFLLARIAEDEAAAERAASFGPPGTPDFERDDYGCLRVQPARVLEECAAKRFIVEGYENMAAPRLAAVSSTPSMLVDVTAGGRADSRVLLWVLKALALPYADHPDYREEWRP